MRSTVLIQTTSPHIAGDLTQALARYGTATHVAGAYEIVLEITAGADETGRTVLEIQAIDGIARTLTLPHVNEEDLR